MYQRFTNDKISKFYIDVICKYLGVMCPPQKIAQVPELLTNFNLQELNKNHEA